MDVYLDRYPRHHAWNARYIWTTEAFLWEHLRNVSNATLNSDKGFGLLVMRVKNHTRGQPANSNFRQWKHNLQTGHDLPTGRPRGYPGSATDPILSNDAPDFATYAPHYEHVCRRQPEIDCSRPRG